MLSERDMARPVTSKKAPAASLSQRDAAKVVSLFEGLVNPQLALRPQMNRPTMTLPVPLPVKLPAQTNTTPTKSGKAKGAQETLLTNEIAEKLMAAARSGLSQKAAADWAGVHDTTLSRWLHRSGEPYETFATLWAQAKQYPKLFLLDGVMANAYAEPETALKMLERLEPETYGKVVVVDPGGGGGAKSFTANFNVTLGQALEQAIAAPLKEIGSGTTIIPATTAPRDPRPPKVKVQ